MYYKVGKQFPFPCAAEAGMTRGEEEGGRGWGSRPQQQYDGGEADNDGEDDRDRDNHVMDAAAVPFHH
jgi:hypothetical protein